VLKLYIDLVLFLKVIQSGFKLVDGAKKRLAIEITPGNAPAWLTWHLKW
jgi:hypothetical protein